jgi:Cyclic nucleotide-binding domain
MTLTLDRKAELLSAARLFDGVDAEGMDRIAAVAVQVDFPADHVVARQGEIGTGFFVVVSGGARVIRDGQTIATVQPGDFFGELSVLDGRPRVLGLRGCPARRAEGGPSDPAGAGHPVARPDRGVTTLTRPDPQG